MRKCGLQVGFVEAFLSGSISANCSPDQLGHGNVAGTGFSVKPLFVFGIQIDEGSWHCIAYTISEYEKYDIAR